MAAVNGLDRQFWIDTDTVVINEGVTRFVLDTAHYDAIFKENLSSIYHTVGQSRTVDRVFELIYGLILFDPSYLAALGDIPVFRSVDLSQKKFSGRDLTDASIQECLLFETDLTGSLLDRACFKGSILEGVRLDGASLRGTDFRGSQINNILVYDEFGTDTYGHLYEEHALQWLFSRGARVDGEEKLNRLMGQPWYEAAHEVVKTLLRKSAGTFHQSSLTRGTKMRDREFAESFVEYIIKTGMIIEVHKAARGGGYVVEVARDAFQELNDFTTNGRISERLAPFFAKQMNVRSRE